jgi:hypothetical protein
MSMSCFHWAQRRIGFAMSQLIAYDAETPKINRLEVAVSMPSIAATCKIAGKYRHADLHETFDPVRLDSSPKGYNRTTFNDLRPVAGT